MDVSEPDGRKTVGVLLVFAARPVDFQMRFVNKFYMAYDGFLHRRTDGAMIRLITPVDGNLEAAQEKLNFFPRDLIPVLKNYIPD